MRATNSTSLYLFGLEATSGRANDFTLTANLAELRGTATDAAIVTTEQGTRVAVAVPARNEVALVDPLTSVVSFVGMPAAYDKLAIVTQADGGSTFDTVLLYGGSASSVSFWSLGATLAQPYRSLETVRLAFPASDLLSVPAPRTHLKILSGASSGFFVLNLKDRTVSPLNTPRASKLTVSDDASRLWLLDPAATGFASVDLANLHPVTTPFERRVDALYDVERIGGGRALVALEARGSFAISVFDATTPDVEKARSTFGLLLGGVR